MESASTSRPVEDLDGKINQLLEALSTTQMITNHFREITDMERASISHHVEDLEDKINKLLVPLSTTQMITNHFKLNREITDMERASISHHVEDLEGRINKLLVPLSTTQMITNHFILNQEITDAEWTSISHHVGDLEGKIKQLLGSLSRTQGIIKAYKLNLEKAAEDLEDIDDLKKRTVEYRGKKPTTLCTLSKRPLIKAMLENKLKDQKDFIGKYPEAVKAEIDDFGNTVFHLIVEQTFNSEAVKLLKMLVSKVLVDSPATLEILNVNNMTALDIAASAGNTKAVKVFVEKYKRLLSKEEEEMEMLPVHHAALWGRKDTVRYLLSVTDWTDEEFALYHCASLLRNLIKSNLHGIALELLKHYPKLALYEENDYWDAIIQMLSEKYLAFKSGRRLGFWERLIYHYIPLKDDQDRVAWWPNGDSKDDDEEKQNPKCSTNCSEELPTLPQTASTIDALKKRLYIVLWNAIQLVPSIKRIHDDKLMHKQTLEIVRLLISEVHWTYEKASERLKRPVLTAARLGIHEFVKEVLKAYPNSVFFHDENRQNIFLLAVWNRWEKVFSLMHKQVLSMRDHNNYITDKEGRNILHLAGELVPSSHVPGAALQMQREMQWFKGIKHLFQPFLQEQRNKLGKTPGEVFTENHKQLMEDGEKWMRDTATSCSVVAALIITIVFAAAFTVPGGVNSDGIPNYLNETYFRIFAVSVAISLFASTTSVQMFLGNWEC